MEGQGAPGELELVRQFVNTLDLETGEEELATAADLGAWLRHRELLAGGSSTSERDRCRAIELREALRALLVANNGGGDAGDALAVLDRAARRAGVELRFPERSRAELRPAAAGVDAALGRLLAIVAEAMTLGTWARLKACRAEGCRWAFYDRARNRSRAWCSMAVCGNRTKARTYRRRRAAPDRL
jgi:predicted RNA-binding Zn ribbon-like protein